MHPRVMAQRRAQAHERMAKAVGVLSDRFGVPLEERPALRAMDAATGALIDLEQSASFLEALAQATAPAMKELEAAAVKAGTSSSKQAVPKPKG